MYDPNKTYCVRCNTEVDSTTSHTQTEYMRINGKRIKCLNHYCPDCTRLLTTIGAGERTAMQDRAGHVASDAPETKQD